MGLPAIVRVVLGLAIAAHFAAVLTAVTSAGARDFPPPPLAVEANRLVMPYLKLFQLTSAYRFFAPNPGPTDLIWFRVRLRSGPVRWVEWPSRGSRWPGIRDQRELVTAMGLRAHLTSSPQRRAWARLDPAGQACVSSFARYIARTQGTEPDNPVETVQVYLVSHRMLMPYEVQMGWEHTDLRLYQPILHLGAYDGAGRAVADPFRDSVGDAPVPPSVFAQRVLQEDVHRPAGETAALSLPRPIEDFLVRFPAFTTPTASETELRVRIEQAILDRDRPERILDPARRAFERQLRARR